MRIPFIAAPTSKSDVPSVIDESNGEVVALAPPEGGPFPYWEAAYPINGTWAGLEDKTLVNTGSTLSCAMDVAVDYDIRYTDANTYGYESGSNDLTYTWTCTAGRFVDSNGVPTTPSGALAYWQAKTSAGVNMLATSVTITCTVSDANQSQNGEAGNRHDPDLVLTQTIEVGRLSYSTLDVVPLNDGYDEQNLDQSGAATPDNDPRWNAAAVPPALEHRIIAADLDPKVCTVSIRTAVDMAGTLSFSIPPKIRVYRTDLPGLPQITTSIAVANARNYDLPLKIEGIIRSDQVGDVAFDCYFTPSPPFTFSGNSYGVTATKTLTVAQVDLNVSGSNYYPGSHGANEEKPGMFMPINDDFDEGRVDAAGNPIADNLAPDGIVGTDDELRDASLTINPPGLDGKWKLAIPARLKVWRQLVANGPWTQVPSGVDSAAVTIPENGLTIPFKIEGVALGSSALPDFTGTFTTTSTPTVIMDKVKVTVAKLDLDVNNNGNTTDSVDRIGNYLPGYNGNTRVLSTSTSFKTPQYVGQQITAVLNGVGSSSGSASTGAIGIDFSISSPTDNNQTPGYCVNGFDAKVGWDGINLDPNKDDDFSFDQNLDDLSQAGIMQASKATVPLWCKDYGGRCVIQADIKAGAQVVGTFSFRVPLDNDADDIADRWEIEKVKEWNTQFGVAVPVNNAYFSAGGDVELTDPDGARTDATRLTFSKTVPNVVPSVTNNAVTMGPTTGTPITHAGEHAQTGDRRTVLDEYRGFILDGGGFDSSGQQKFNAFGIVPSGTTGAVAFAGGHVRLSPAHKEFLVAVDAMAGVTNMPTQAGIQGWMNTIALNFGKRQDGAGCRMFYVLHDLATPHDLFPNAQDNPLNEVDIKNYLRDRVDLANIPSYRPLATFEHLQLADEFGSRATAGIAYQSPIETPGLGAIYAVDKGKETIADYFLIAPDACATSYIAHELHHTIANQTGHFSDTNGNTVVGEADDKDRLLWDYNFAYDTQGKTLPNGVAANATELVLNNTNFLTSTGWVTINPIPNFKNSGMWVKYTGIVGNKLIGCVRIDYNQIPPTLNPPQPLPAFGPGTVVEPRFSAEDYKQIKFGAGTTSHISQFTP